MQAYSLDYWSCSTTYSPTSIMQRYRNWIMDLNFWKIWHVGVKWVTWYKISYFHLIDNLLSSITSFDGIECVVITMGQHYMIMKNWTHFKSSTLRGEYKIIQGSKNGSVIPAHAPSKWGNKTWHCGIHPDHTRFSGTSYSSTTHNLSIINQIHWSQNMFNISTYRSRFHPNVNFGACPS